MKYLEFPSGLRIEITEISETAMRVHMERDDAQGIPAFYATVDGAVVYWPKLHQPGTKVVDE